MLEINVPGLDNYNLKYLVLDYNGTVATDGIMTESVKKKLLILSEILEILIITADTNGTAADNIKGLPIELKRFPKGPAATEKVKVIEKLGSENCVFLGNGFNDVEAGKIATLTLGIIGNEGICSKLIDNSDLIFSNIDDALDSLIHTNRIVAGLRK